MLRMYIKAVLYLQIHSSGDVSTRSIWSKWNWSWRAPGSFIRAQKRRTCRCSGSKCESFRNSMHQISVQDVSWETCYSPEFITERPAPPRLGQSETPWACQSFHTCADTTITGVLAKGNTKHGRVVITVNYMQLNQAKP